MAVPDSNFFQTRRSEQFSGTGRTRDTRLYAGRARLLAILEALAGLSALLLIMACAVSARWLLWLISTSLS